MNIQDYAEDKGLVIQLHEMARHYDSEFLRNVADKMDIMIEDKIKHDREQLSKS
jgi:hypothetical protein